MALTRAGNIPQESDRQAGSRFTSANRHTKKMAAIHSTTLEIWITQVGIDNAFMVLFKVLSDKSHSFFPRLLYHTFRLSS